LATGTSRMILNINPQNPQQRLIRKVVDLLNDGAIIALPTDSVYALGCRLTDKKAITRLYQIKKAEKSHPMSLLCADQKHIAVYAHISTPAYKVLRRLLPGPYTFILDATREVPDRMLTRQRTVGLRVPDNIIVHDIVRELGEPILATTAEVEPWGLFLEAEEIETHLGKQLGYVIEGGILPDERSTIIDLTDDEPVLVRPGKGEFEI